ncbi:MAG TPA: hypothetical protein VHN79_13185, partial [Lacunisphaera sp.]|nr:hypothetical protein [Lacunisphaera sp.]
MVVVLTCAAWLSLAAAQESPSPFPPITTVGDFWNIPEAEKHQPHPVSMELHVHFYDAAWNLLWGQTGADVSYLTVGGKALPLKAGQKVRLEGTVIPSRGFDGELLKVTILGEAPLPEPVKVAGRMGELAKFNARRIEIEGYVLRQTEPDSTHIEAKLFTEGRVIGLSMQISPTEPLPHFVGTRVRVRGICDTVPDPAGVAQNVECWVLEG